MLDLTGRIIDQRYRLDVFVGNGSLGGVYQAFDLKLSRPVAFTHLFADLMARPGFANRLAGQLRLLVQLNHPFIATLHTFNLDGDTPYVVVEWATPALALRPVAGNDLPKLFEQMAQLAEALAHAHQRAVYHGRLHPGNIRHKVAIRPGQGMAPLILTSLGLSQLLDQEQLAADLRPYQAPEQVKGQPFDGRADIFALGVVLYQLLTGQLPADPPQPASQLRPGLPPALDQLLQTALAPAPANRFQTAGEMAAGLRAISLKADQVAAPVVGPAAGLADELTVNHRANGPRRYPLNKTSLTIGSAPDNDLVLEGLTPRHFRLERGPAGWRITDLGQQQAARLGDSRLLPGLTESWPAATPLTIAPYRLVWQPAAAQAPLSAPTPASPTKTPPRPAALVAAAITPGFIRLAPFERADIQLTLTNLQPTVTHCQLSLEGIPAGWVTFSTSRLQLLPESQALILLAVQPQIDSQFPAGTYLVQVWAVGQALATFRLQLAPLVRVRAECHPSQLRNRGQANLTIYNEGNVETSCHIEAKDEANVLAFDGRPDSLSLRPGQTETISLQIGPRRGRPLLGNVQQLRYSLGVVPAGAETAPEPLTGSLELRPYIPLWLVTLLLPVTMICCLVVAFLSTQLYNRAVAQAATATAMIALTPSPGPPATATPPPPPQSCADIKAANPTAEDGDYTIYPAGNAAQPLPIYCHNLADTPLEYLSLPTSDETANYALTRADDSNYLGRDVLTIYQKIRLDPATLIVDLTDTTFATSTGSINDGQIHNTPYGTAAGCRGSLALGAANINLTGTPLTIAPDQPFALQGDSPVGQPIDIQANGQIINLVGGGRCGYLAPDGDLQLVYLFN